MSLTNHNLLLPHKTYLHLALLVLLGGSGGPAMLMGQDPATADSIEHNADSAAELSEVDLQFFETHIRPVLATSCLECHSTETELSGGLSLDSRQQILAGGDSGAAIELDVQKISRLLTAIEYTDPNLQMPPDEKLSDDVVAAFRKWIQRGLPDPRQVSSLANAPPQTGLPVERAHEHWAYRPFQPVDDSHASVDTFVNTKLQSLGLSPGPPATPRSLVRRLYFDLTGLPPTPEAIDRVCDDPSDLQLEGLVDELLHSTAFGETFARHWMDVVRYGESITLRGFVLPEAWRYRDYLIQSFNSDRPFDQMIREQVAGDLLNHDSFATRQMQLTATAFLAMGNTNLEQQDKAQLEMDYIDEQLEVIGRAFLGQTIGCARCHDHKFDPIPTRDYYAMAGILRSAVGLQHDNVSKWIDAPLPMDDSQEQRFASIQTQVERLSQQIAEIKNSLSEHESPKFVSVDALDGVVVDNPQARLVGSWESSQYVPRIVGTEYLFHTLNAAEEATATFEPKTLAPGTYEVRLAYTAGSNRASNARVEVFSGDGERSLQINQRQKPPEDGLWISLGTYRFEKDGQAFVMLFTDRANGHVIADAVQFLPIPMATNAPAAVANQQPAERQQPETTPGDKSDQESAQRLRASLAELEASLKSKQAVLNARPHYLTVLENGTAEDIPIHIRGNVHTLGEVVPRGFLTALGEPRQIPTGSSGRLELAKWLSDARSPLAARVYANRVWSWLMGQGIVSTVNNFGTTGTQPTHPELLDWLAQELIRSGWSTKHLVRIIVSSQAYRRAIVKPAQMQADIDPDNQFYWRGHRRRLTAEALRDAMLSISGELDTQIGGSLIKPGTSADYNYVHTGHRRSVYQPVFRNSLPELFEAFDFADPSASIGKRPRSTVATQALVLTNHAWVIARAQAAAQKTLREHPQASSEQLVRACYVQCFQRPPGSEELQIASEYLRGGGEDDLEPRLQGILHALFASIDFRYLD